MKQKKKKGRELRKEKLISEGYSPDVAEETVKGKRIYMQMSTKKEYYRRFGEEPLLTYEEWLRRYDLNMRVSVGRGLFQDKFGRNYIRKLTKKELREAVGMYREERKQAEKNK